MAQEYFGFTLQEWSYVAALLIFITWPVIWKWRGKDWFADSLTSIYKIFYSEDEYDVEQHEDVLDLQAKYFGLVFFWFMYIPIVLIDLNLIGVLGTNETSQNIYIGGAGLTLAGIFGGGAVINYLMTGARLLLTGAFGLGNFCEGFHPHGDIWSGWIKKVEIFSTVILTPDFGTLIIANSLLLEYRIKNYDRSPFYHEMFEIPVTNENKTKLVGIPATFNKEGKQIKKAIKSKFLETIENQLENFILVTNTYDSEYFGKVLPNLNWATVSSPSCTLKDDDTAILRFPVRNYLDGLTLRHEMSRRNLLDTSYLDEDEEDEKPVNEKPTEEMKVNG